jgi:hypothetical protein
MPARQIELQFPLKGLNESQAFVRQLGGQSGTHTTAKCENVVGFDPVTGRNRGAARAGTRKYCPDRIDGDAAGQCLVHVVSNVEISTRDTGSSSSPARETRVTASGVLRALGAGSIVVTASRVTTLLGVANGTVALITPAGATVVNSGTAALSSSRRIILAVAFFSDVYFCDGANYKYYDTSAEEVLAWTAATGGTIPAQEANYLAITDATNTTPIVITSVAHGQTDGDIINVSGVLGNTAANGRWTITNLTDDTFELVDSVGNGAYTSGGLFTRQSGSRCSLIAVWGGRIVMSGLDTDPNNIFMSAVGDPFDWNYSPDIQTVQQAVAGNVTSGFGKNPDIVTALIPYTDDVLLIGGTRSIRRFLGNPADGGINVSVTEITGVAYGAAWCQSPEGIIYFFGSRGGVYRIDPENGIPNRLTAMTIDERLADIDLNANLVTLEWDDRAIAVRVYITPADGTKATHYVWDVRNEAWWPFTYANPEHNPMAVHLLSGNTVEERRILEYGQDGYIRFSDVDSESDDGSPIESFVYLGPFSATMFVELAASLREGSNTVTWEFCSASSLERALTAVPRQTGRIISGRNGSQWPRAFVERGYLRLSATGPWALEHITAAVEQVGDTMNRIMRSTP